MFHDIVVPLDGSVFAERALELARWMAHECDGRLHLVRAPVPASITGETAESARDDALVYLTAVASKLERDGKPQARAAVVDGSPAIAIANYADRVGADLIVMTTHGRTGEERRHLGSVAGVVMHHASCPVLLVRPTTAIDTGAPAGPFDQILIAVDGTGRAERVDALALQLGMMGHPRFRVLRTIPKTVPAATRPSPVAMTEPAGDRRRLVRAEAEGYVSDTVRRLRAIGVRAEVLVQASDAPADAIVRAAQHDASNLIVLGMRWTENASVSPATLTEALLRESSLPLLVVREAQ